jgi:hypothetical protein
MIGPSGESKVASLCRVFKFFHRMGGGVEPFQRKKVPIGSSQRL